MRRPGGSRIGAHSTVSVLLALGALAGVPATGQAAPEDGGPTRLAAAAARAATAVELPHPARGAKAVRLLGDRLDEAAAANDMAPAELTDLLTGDRTAWLDESGALFYKEEQASAPAQDSVAAVAPLDQTFLLHSRPGATKKIYLDFDGGTASGTAWHANYPATPTTQPAWDPSGNGPAFDDDERTAIQTAWQVVAEDYAPFDVDVTTEDPGPGGIFRSSATDVAYGSHVMITPSDAAVSAICGTGCGGVAYVDVFDSVNGNGGGAAGDGYGYVQPAWVFPQRLGNSAKNIGEAAAHEVGHNFGLSHDGTATQGYYAGHGSWAPIMGVGYSKSISQWSKGDYAGANEREDDVAVIRGIAGSRADEAPATTAGAPALPSGTAYVTSRGDVDTYLLGTCSGPTTVDADPLASFADLDIKLSILDATGQVVATADPASAQVSSSTASGMDASISQTLPAGTYYASVDGVGNGAWSTGYDDYGSLGAYRIASTGCDGAAPTGTPSAPTNVFAEATATTGTLSWSAPASVGAGTVTGYVLTRSGDPTPVQLGPTATSYTWSGLAPATTYGFTVTALNSRGPGPSASAEATTAPSASLPTAPRNVSGTWQGVQQRAVLSFDAPASSGSSAVTKYDVSVDGTYRYTVASPGSWVIPMTTGQHTVGVAAASSSGRGAATQVSITMPPKVANDGFAQRTALSGASGTVAGDNTESSSEAGEPAPPAARSGSGGASVWYAWTAPASGPVTMTTDSPDAGRDTTLAVYTGSALGSLSLVAGNDDTDGTDRLSTAVFTASAGTTYAIAVDGYRTSTGVGRYALSWAPAAPTAPSDPTPTKPTTSSDVASSGTTVRAPRTARAGSRPTVVVTVTRGSAPAAGKVVVSVGGRARTLTLVSGRTRVRLPRLKPGRLRITVHYLGDATTATSGARWTIRVRR